MKLNPLYKKLLLLAMVFGPIFWLVFSEDGRRRADIVLLTVVKGGETLNLAFSKLHSTATETDLRGNFPDVAFTCVDQASNFGDRLCSAPIVSFNGAPASEVSAFFTAGQLRALKLVYQPAHSAYVHGFLRRELGEPSTDRSFGDSVYRWRTIDGLVVMPAREPQTLDDATILWLANTTLTE